MKVSLFLDVKWLCYGREKSPVLLRFLEAGQKPSKESTQIWLGVSSTRFQIIEFTLIKNLSSHPSNLTYCLSPMNLSVNLCFWSAAEQSSKSMAGWHKQRSFQTLSSVGAETGLHILPTDLFFGLPWEADERPGSHTESLADCEDMTLEWRTHKAKLKGVPSHWDLSGLSARADLFVFSEQCPQPATRWWFVPGSRLGTALRPRALGWPQRSEQDAATQGCRLTGRRFPPLCGNPCFSYWIDSLSETWPLGRGHPLCNVLKQFKMKCQLCIENTKTWL